MVLTYEMAVGVGFLIGLVTAGILSWVLSIERNQAREREERIMQNVMRYMEEREHGKTRRGSH